MICDKDLRKPGRLVGEESINILVERPDNDWLRDLSQGTPLPRQRLAPVRLARAPWVAQKSTSRQICSVSVAGSDKGRVIVLTVSASIASTLAAARFRLAENNEPQKPNSSRYH